MKKQLGAVHRRDIPSDTRKEAQHIINSLINITKVLAGIVILLIGGVIFLAYQLGSDHAEPIASRQPTATPQKAVAKADTQTSTQPAPPAEPQTRDGKDVQTGLLVGEGMQIVKTTCTACHSSELILQNRFTREGWHEKIVWMQETQGLWDLGENEDIILDYLAANYAPEEPRGRRRPLSNIEWYQLEVGTGPPGGQKTEAVPRRDRRKNF